jgi:hypothetical protein
MPLLANITNTIKGLIDYSDPVKTLTAIMTALNVPQATAEMVLGYAKNKINNVTYIDAVINLLTTYASILNDPFYDYFNFEEKIIYLESKTTNPITGQPYGFGSVDLETGEVYQDGVYVKTLTGTPRQTTKATEKQSQTNIWPLVLVIGGAVLLRKKKRKNK